MSVEAQLAVIAEILGQMRAQLQTERAEALEWRTRADSRLRSLESWNYRALGALCVLSMLASAGLAVLR